MSSRLNQPSAIKTDLFAAATRTQKINRLGDPLLAFEKYIDFAALAARVDAVAPRKESTRGGRPPYPTETMVRILFIKRLNNLSDEQIEYQLLDRMSYQRFCGLSDSANIPDRTTVWTFENRIGAVGAKALFEEIDQQLFNHGFLARGGQIIDATLVPAPKQHFTREEKEQLVRGEIPGEWNEAKRRQKDLDTTWTKKHGKSYHGYKLSISIDKRHKVIRRIVTDTASTHDSQHFDAVLDPCNSNSDVYADKGYASGEREAQLESACYRNRIQRKGARNHPLSKRQEGRNQRIVKTRARVEHIFATMTQMGGKLIRTIGQARANFAMILMATGYNLKRLVYLREVQVATS